MSIAWFPFNIKDFVANTMRLTTEAKGAYLMLMLDYYEQGESAPDDDDVLAAITGLSLEAWRRHRKVLAPLFQIRDGFWQHDRIEQEMREAEHKLSLSTARAVAGGKARQANLRQGKAQAEPQAQPLAQPKQSQSRKRATSKAQAEPVAEPAQSPQTAHLHLHLSSNREREEGALSQVGNGLGEEAPTAPVSVDQGLTGIPIPADFEPVRHAPMSDAETVLAGSDEWAGELEKFKAHYAANGKWSRDWLATWLLWCSRWHDYRQKNAARTAPPRVELSAAVDWEAAVKSWKRFGRWARGIGPDPESPACRAPPEILAAHGITAGVPAR